MFVDLTAIEGSLLGMMTTVVEISVLDDDDENKKCAVCWSAAPAFTTSSISS